MWSGVTALVSGVDHSISARSKLIKQYKHFNLGTLVTQFLMVGGSILGLCSQGVKSKWIYQWLVNNCNLTIDSVCIIMCGVTQ